MRSRFVRLAALASAADVSTREAAGRDFFSESTPKATISKTRFVPEMEARHGMYTVGRPIERSCRKLE